MKKLFTFALVLLSCAALPAKNSIKLKFNDKGTFKVAQFTDIHWIHESPNCEKTVATIKHVLKTEKPDLAVITGDIVWKKPSRQPWTTISQIFEEEKVPFAVALGDHDGEESTKITRDEIFDIFLKSPYFIGEKGPKDVEGTGNYVLPVYGKDNKPAALIYCLDTHRVGTHFPGYDGIFFSQIKWYREQSEKYTKANDNKPLPALAFYHIPIPEYMYVVGDPNTVGAYGEPWGCAELNTGFFDSVLDKKDIFAMFCGHDHYNDYIGTYKGVALAYGRTTGDDAYWNKDRGSRIVEIKEGSRDFNTWIRTKNTDKDLLYNSATALSSEDQKNMKYVPGQKVSPRKQGVAFMYTEIDGVRKVDSEIREREMKVFEDTIYSKRLATGTQDKFTPTARGKKGYVYEYYTYIKIPKRDAYRFDANTDSETQVFIDDYQVINTEHASFGKIALEPGYHLVHVFYRQRYTNGGRLSLSISDINTPKRVIPDNWYYIPNN